MSPNNKKKLDLIRIKLDKLDNSLIKIIKKRTYLVNQVLKLKDKKKEIIDTNQIAALIDKAKEIEAVKKKDKNKIKINILQDNTAQY